MTIQFNSFLSFGDKVKRHTSGTGCPVKKRRTIYDLPFEKNLHNPMLVVTEKKYSDLFYNLICLGGGGDLRFFRSASARNCPNRTSVKVPNTIFCTV